MKRTMSKEELIDIQIPKQLKKEKSFYRIDALNYTGVCTDGTPYSEVIAKWLYEQFDCPEKLKELLLQGSNMQPEREFKIEPIHRGEDIKYSPDSNRNEENIAKRMFQMKNFTIVNQPELNLVDYQVPVNRRFASAEGKVDLVFSDGKCIVIGELKDEDSPETLLRAVVEAKTYQYKIENCSSALLRFTRCYTDQKVPIDWVGPAIVIFTDNKSQPGRDYQSAKQSEGWIIKLIKRWDIQIFEINIVKDCKAFEEREYSLKWL